MWTQPQLLQPVPPFKLFHSFPPSNHAKIPSLSKLNSTHNPKNHYGIVNSTLTLEELPPNALRRKKDAEWFGGFSLGVDLGMARTGIALSKGFVFRPLTVLQLRGQKLEVQIINIAEQVEADEFIIGLPKSFDGKETIQSNIVRSVAGKLAIRAAERGWRVYLHDEYGTTTAAIDRMIDMGVNRSQQKKQDAYAAVVRILNLFCPRILNYNENLEGVLLEMKIFSQTKINHRIKELVPFHHSCFLISSMREEVARKWRHSNNC